MAKRKGTKQQSKVDKTDNTMVKRKRKQQQQPMGDKKVNRKLKFEQQKLH